MRGAVLPVRVRARLRQEQDEAEERQKENDDACPHGLRAYSRMPCALARATVAMRGMQPNPHPRERRSPF
jgi:hypothetical protein